MKLFACQNCRQLLYFENTRCERCGSDLGYLPGFGELSALAPAGGEEARRPLLAAAAGNTYRACANAAAEACNWLVPAGSPTPYCAACRHNRTIPDISTEANLARWRRIEFAKHRLFYTLLKLRLPTPTRAESPEAGFAFDFKADPADPAAPKVLTGHDEGLITIALAEADDAERERRRRQHGEPYRTLLGHLRHEVGHYYWDRLVRDAGRLDACRAVFGDDTEDYAEALRRHYANGPRADWRESFVSSYASTHAWEDFAETWAHYLHIVDTLETAAAFRLQVDPTDVAPEHTLAASVDFDVYEVEDFATVLRAWLPLAFAVNSLNRSMGQPDLYPFVLSAPAVEKLAYMHGLVRDGRVR